MNKIYRLRPASDETLEELETPYLWFSIPTGYKDKDDANVVAFCEKNETVRESFDRVFGNYQSFGQELSRLGICCFTKSLPGVSKWKKFPNGCDAIFVEYDKIKLEEHFLSLYNMGNCFKDVQYSDKPLLLESSTDNGYDVLWEETKYGKIYRSLRGDIERDPRLREQFIFKLLTKINAKFKIQKEMRIILPSNIKSYSLNLKGYKIAIPRESIRKIYYNKHTDSEYVARLQKMGYSIEIM